MKVVALDPPRKFRVGAREDVELSDCGRIELRPDEQVTFTTESGGEYDVARKAWGFYATPSLNGRLPWFGLRPALVKGLEDKFFVMLVEHGHEPCRGRVRLRIHQARSPVAGHDSIEISR